MIFGWVGIAKVARSMSLQIKTRGYVDAANMMGQKDSKIILKHIVTTIAYHMLLQVLQFQFQQQLPQKQD